MMVGWGYCGVEYLLSGGDVGKDAILESQGGSHCDGAETSVVVWLREKDELFISSVIAAEPFESVDDDTNEDDGMMWVLGIWFDMPFVLAPKESAVGIPVLGSLDKSTRPFGLE